MALWAIFIAAGLMLLNFRDKQKLKYAFLFCLGASFYFLFIMKLVMPVLANEGREYLHFQYDAIGKNFSEAITTIITKPRYTFNILFENHLKDAIANGIKSELHFTILFSGGFVLLLRPQYLVMLAPIYAQKLFNDDFGKWGLNAQYSIEFAPILTIALFNWLLDFKESKKKMYLSIGFTVLTLYTTLASIDNRVSKWYNSVNHKFYSSEHYKREFDVKKMYEALKLIPTNAIVCAQSPLVSHLAFRDYIYQFPNVANSEYIILSEKENSYPLNQEEYDKIKKEYFASPEWQVIYNENYTCIFKRIR